MRSRSVSVALLGVVACGPLGHEGAPAPENDDASADAGAGAADPGDTADVRFVLVEADTYVRDGEFALASYGDQSGVAIKTVEFPGTNRHAFLRFQLAPAGSFPLGQAILHLCLATIGPDATAAGGEFEVYRVDDDAWDEHAMTWLDQPAPGALVVSGRATTPGAMIELDVTSAASDALDGDRTLSLMLRTPRDVGADGWMSFAAREVDGPEPEQKPRLGPIDGASGAVLELLR